MKDKIIEIIAEELLGVIPIHKGPFVSSAEARRVGHHDNKKRFEVAERIATRIEEELSDEWVSGTPNNDGYYDALTSENKVFIALRKNNKWWGDEAQDGKVLFGLKDDFVTHYRSLPPTPKS